MKVIKVDPPIDFVEVDWAVGCDPAYGSGGVNFTEKDFCLSLEKVYWADKWSWKRRLKFEVKWLLGRYRY